MGIAVSQSNLAINILLWTLILSILIVLFKNRVFCAPTRTRATPLLRLCYTITSALKKSPSTKGHVPTSALWPWTLLGGCTSTKSLQSKRSKHAGLILFWASSSKDTSCLSQAYLEASRGRCSSGSRNKLWSESLWTYVHCGWASSSCGHW